MTEQILTLDSLRAIATGCMEALAETCVGEFKFDSSMVALRLNVEPMTESIHGCLAGCSRNIGIALVLLVF